MGRLPKKRPAKRAVATRGGYPSGEKTLSELKPPPKGPGAGVKRPPEPSTN
jgi:hypothetical protein